MARTATMIAVLYVAFAGFSSAINIGCQMISVWAYKGPYSVEVSMLVGTAAALPVRYLLEKRYVFEFKSRNISHDGQLFFLYGFMGVFTTAIFWGVEYAFHLLFATDAMRYLGGLIGLAIGFYVRYQLNKKFVFVGDDKQVIARC